MDLIKFAIQNPVKVIVGVLLVVLFGLVSLTAIPIQLTPDIERPVISVRTSWTGRSPEEVEKSIILEQEEKLKTVQGLYKMTSTIQLGRGDISLEFDVGYDIGRALQDVSNKLDEVPEYPDDVDRPIVRASDSASDDAIAYGLLQSEDRLYDIADFYDYADRHVKPALERIAGISELTIYGGREHQVQVRFDPEVLAQKGITIDGLRASLVGDNVSESAGDMENGRQDVRFRVLGRFESLEQVKQTIVKYDDGAPIRIGDIATAELVLEKNIHFDQCKGKPSMTFVFRREVGANILDIMREVRLRLDELNGPGGLLRGYKNDRHRCRLRLVSDDTVYIYSALGLVRRNLLLGGSLAVIVLLLFLRSARPTLIVAVAIPISLIGTFLVMAVTGRNVNVISLAGLSFAVGMVVDNAIVVLENIDRHLSMGKSPLSAAYGGCREVWGAILSSTLTTIAVFAPVLTIREEAGQLFYDIALAICAAVGLSLVVSITVIPMAASKLLRRRSRPRLVVTRVGKSLFGLAPLLRWFSNAFARAIHLMTLRSVSGVWLRMIIIAVIIGSAFWLSRTLMPPASYLPNGNKNLVMGFLFCPPSYSLRQNITVGRRLEDSLRPYWDAKDSKAATALGTLVDPKTKKEIKEVSAIHEFFFVIYRSRVFMFCVSKDPNNVKPMEAILANAMKEIPGAYGMASQRSLFGRNMGNSNSVTIEVVGVDMNRLTDSTAYLQEKLADEFSVMAIRSSPENYNESGPERQIVIDQIRTKELGINVQALAIAARSMVDGAIVGDFDFEGDNIDLVILRDPSLPISPDEVDDIPLAVVDNNGETVTLPLGELVRFQPAEASQQIRRVEQQRAIRLTVNPPEEMALEEVQAKIMDLVAESRREGGMTADTRILVSGNTDKLSRTRAALTGKWSGWNVDSIMSVALSRFVLALLITYLLMAALFESFVYPFVIMFSVPLATVGGFAGLAIVHHLDPTQQMDMLTMLGFVILIGVVVNNAILLVHQTLNFMRGIGESEGDRVEPMEPRDAIRESVRTRIRPIFMTTATSVIGMLPLVISPGAGSELYRGLGAVVIGGLVCATIFTLVVVPLLLSLMIDLQAGFGRMRDLIRPGREV
ncbi:MAG: efflux RND transporter permease subunit [Planctomycetes bacterium]|nr:efflux RND transporter permease subunit [Planctomycetota bacterium]